MHDEQLNQNDLSPAAIEQLASEHSATTDYLDQRIIHALETVPELQIPADFAARVAARLPARRPVSLTQTHYGYTAMLLGVLATFAAMLALALHTARHATFGLPESLLLTQFIVFAIWLSVRRPSLR
jgi:hypothetical protein